MTSTERKAEEIRYPHSLWIVVGSQDGYIGDYYQKKTLNEIFLWKKHSNPKI
ncbi:MAG: hypothetical protein H6Q67_914 [Firmicutes bacterium]|nr:hypothetical protein [Bacillota bacterium]